MRFIGRKSELSKLDAEYNRDSSFVVIYGRRRVGKTTLIKEFLKEKTAFYFLATEELESQSMKRLAGVVARTTKNTLLQKAVFTDWVDLFQVIADYKPEEKKVLVIDEFPYLVEQSSELPSVLQKLVDEKLLKYNLVLCGSSQNMMYGLFLDSTAPLYGRADEIMKLAPIRLPYIQEALSLDAMNAIEEYAVWGGVPRYWELRENQNSLNDALWHNILSVNGTLYEEPIKLFQDDVKDIVKTSTIMSYIGTGANRLSEIAARCNEPATNLSRPLKKLIDLGFLEKDVPFGIDEKNAKKSLYKIADPFMAFYYQFVVPNRSFIELGRRLPIEQALTAHLSEYVSMQWEKLCRDAVTGNLVNGVVYGKAKRWWGSVLNEDKKPEQVEFDVMAESLDKKYLLVGECKWTTQENGKQLTAELLRKANLLPFAKCYTVVPMLFLKNAPKDGIRNAVLPENIVELMK